MYLQCAIVSLQLTAQALQLAAGQDGFAVLVPQVVLFLDQLGLLLLQSSHLLLRVAVLFKLNETIRYLRKTVKHLLDVCFESITNSEITLMLILISGSRAFGDDSTRLYKSTAVD